MTHLLMLLALAAADPAAPPDEDAFGAYTAASHLELGVGFTGGVRDETLAPYGNPVVYGLACELRLVTRHLRFTAGLQKPFASLRLADALGAAEVHGTAREVGTRALSLWDVRLGLGLEYAFRYVTPFIDVIGDVQSVSASLTVDGLAAHYQAWTFGIVARAGLRVQLGQGVYLAPAAELGLGGPLRWAVGLQAGWLLALG